MVEKVTKNDPVLTPKTTPKSKINSENLRFLTSNGPKVGPGQFSVFWQFFGAGAKLKKFNFYENSHASQRESIATQTEPNAKNYLSV